MHTDNLLNQTGTEEPPARCRRARQSCRNRRVLGQCGCRPNKKKFVNTTPRRGSSPCTSPWGSRKIVKPQTKNRKNSARTGPKRIKPAQAQARRLPLGSSGFHPSPRARLWLGAVSQVPAICCGRGRHVVVGPGLEAQLRGLPPHPRLWRLRRR
jgi:hypothetical protein